jgi:uncharacterized protein YbjQ (UPF0145 family)
MGPIFNILLFFVGLAVAYLIGSMNENNHYEELEQAEREQLNLPVINLKTIDADRAIEKSSMVYGSVVISLDYFKRFLAGLRTIFGGRMKSYETLLDRARRESLRRLKAKAMIEGYDQIVNLRFETSSTGSVTSQKGSLGCFEVLAYGTAVKFH